MASTAIGSIVGAVRDRGGRGQPTSTATRSLYQPQDGHTVCGSLASPHRGQMLRDGASQLPRAGPMAARLHFDFFFLGTAIVVSLDERASRC